jgi:radical SAM family RiPP maturation amino acid epimerase
MSAPAIETLSLLGDLSEVPADYIRDVAHSKRFLERWSMDPRFREQYWAEPQAAIDSLGLALTPAQTNPLIGAKPMADGLDEPDVVAAPDDPPSVHQYRSFIVEKLHMREAMRELSPSSNRRLAIWRTRQISRCITELGPRSAAVVHAPVAIELSSGCTVGCWFCGVAAPRFDRNFPYSDENAELWRACLGVLSDIMGPSIRQGFLYWATDPLDNQDYERFLTDFHAITGRCPQTTTALGHKDVERTRELLRLAHSMGSQVDRFSVIALNLLDRIHAAFTPEELLRVEIVPQNREASELYRKSAAGRALKFATKRANELVEDGESSTIACVSGFLLNMVERSVKLITPCNVNERWPLGYWVVGEGTFASAEELGVLVNRLIDTHCRTHLRVYDQVRLRPDVTISVEDDTIVATTLGGRATCERQPDAETVAAYLSAGTHTVEEIAVAREAAGVPLAATMTLLDNLFELGFFDEEPRS